MTIVKDQVWLSKNSESPALVLRVQSYEVKYQQDGAIKTMGDFEFKDNFNLELKTKDDE